MSQYHSKIKYFRISLYNVGHSRKHIKAGRSPPPTISLPLFLEQTIRIAKLEKEKLVLLDRIADLKRELLFAGLGIRVPDVDESS